MSKITPEDYEQYLSLIEDGYSQRKACEILGLKRSTLQDYIKRKQKEMCCVKQEVLNGIIGNGYSNWITKEKPPIRFDVVDCLKEPNTLIKKPRICYLDIEKSFNISGHYGQWSQNLNQAAKFRESHILSYCYAFNDDEEIKGSVLNAEELQQDFLTCLAEGRVHTTVDELLVLELWALFSNSDVIVAYNGRGFDVKEIQARFLQYGLPPTPPVKVIDPLLIVKDKFRLPFKSLKYVAEFLGVTQKIENEGNKLWKKATMGNAEALHELLEYNKGDITTMREVYKKIQGWGNTGVNLALYSESQSSLCPLCSSDDIKPLAGKFAYTSQRKYRVYRCNSCQAVLRSNRKEVGGTDLVRVV